MVNMFERGIRQHMITYNQKTSLKTFLGKSCCKSSPGGIWFTSMSLLWGCKNMQVRLSSIQKPQPILFYFIFSNVNIFILSINLLIFRFGNPYQNASTELLTFCIHQYTKIYKYLNKIESDVQYSQTTCIPV